METVFSFRRRSALAVLLISTLGLTACQLDSRPDPRLAADQLAAALADRTFTDLPLTEESRPRAAALPEALTALDELDVQATVTDAAVSREDSNRATAHLDVTWDLSALGVQDAIWNYPTTVGLMWDETAEEWELDLTPSAVVAGMSEDGSVDVELTEAVRGRILDAAGSPLMMERPVVRLGLDKSHITADEVESSATAVAEIAGIAPEAFVARAEAAGERAFVEAITLRADGSVPLPTSALQEVPGGRMIEDTAVLAPTRSFARGVLGTYGLPTAEQVEASDGRLTAGVPAGQSGLQFTWDKQLAGTPGVTITLDEPTAGSSSDSSGEPSSDASNATTNDGESPSGSPGVTVDPVPGQDVSSTLDRRLQELAERTLVETEVPTALVAIRPSDGQVLAAATGPESFTTPIATSRRYAPGSVFKVVTALAMLRQGMTPDTVVSCPQSITVDGMQVSNFDGYPASSLGEIPLSEAMAHSCNTAFVGQWQEISAADEAAAGKALGLTADPAVGLTGAFLASIPDDSEGTEHAANLFGQGVIEASPLGMATMAASVAAGKTVQPTLVTSPEVDRPTSLAPDDGGLSQEEAAQLRDLMAGPVDHGTVPILQEVPGAPVLAKTGTAQFVEDGETKAHTWLVAIHGDMAVALLFTEGFGGAQTNGPVMRDFLTAAEEIIPST